MSSRRLARWANGSFGDGHLLLNRHDRFVRNQQIQSASFTTIFRAYMTRMGCVSDSLGFESTMASPLRHEISSRLPSSDSHSTTHDGRQRRPHGLSFG